MLLRTDILIVVGVGPPLSRCSAFTQQLQDVVLVGRIVLGGVGVEEGVNLLEGPPLGLGDKEVGPDSTERCKNTKEDEGAVFGSFDHWRRDEPDDKVVEPVRTGGERDTLGAAG